MPTFSYPLPPQLVRLLSGKLAGSCDDGMAVKTPSNYQAAATMGSYSQDGVCSNKASSSSPSPSAAQQLLLPPPPMRLRASSPSTTDTRLYAPRLRDVQPTAIPPTTRPTIRRPMAHCTCAETCTSRSRGSPKPARKPNFSDTSMARASAAASSAPTLSEPLAQTSKMQPPLMPTSMCLHDSSASFITCGEQSLMLAVWPLFCLISLGSGGAELKRLLALSMGLAKPRFSRASSVSSSVKQLKLPQ
mmetsp:Transcript_97363/g.251750  ORF Transcript_97363/g.251750 Transcript_97363/m.251750 type:complete len:246 (-) Transcript_97363:1083-1820(-)